MPTLEYGEQLQGRLDKFKSELKGLIDQKLVSNASG